MNTTKILYFHQYPDFDTGSPKSLVAMIEGVDRSRFEPVFLAPQPGDLVDELAARDVPIYFGEVNSINPRHPLKSLNWIWKQYRFLKNENIGIIHLNEFGWNSDIVLAAWLLRIPVVLHIHNPGEIHKFNLNRKFSTLVLTCSEKNRSSIKNLEHIEHKSRVLYNQVDLEHIGKGRPIRPELFIKEDDIVVGIVAQVCHRKGIDTLLQTAEVCLPKHPKLKFLIVGPDGSGEQDYAEKMRERASNSGFSDAIIFLGARSDIPDLLASMDIFILPTRSEPFGIVIIEAMAAGLPVIASRVGGIPEIISSDSIGTVVPPDDAAAFTSALESLLDLPDLGSSIGAGAKNHVQGRFDSVSISKSLNEMYGNLL